MRTQVPKVVIYKKLESCKMMMISFLSDLIARSGWIYAVFVFMPDVVVNNVLTTETPSC